MKCAIVNCKNSTHDKSVKFHKFPKSIYQAKWVQACNRRDRINVNSARICEKHFSPDDYREDLRDPIYQSKGKRLKFVSQTLPLFSF